MSQSKPERLWELVHSDRKPWDQIGEETRQDWIKVYHAAVQAFGPFEWMESWLKAYDAANRTSLAKDILDWVNSQPMQQG